MINFARSTEADIPNQKQTSQTFAIFNPTQAAERGPKCRDRWNWRHPDKISTGNLLTIPIFKCEEKRPKMGRSATTALPFAATLGGMAADFASRIVQLRGWWRPLLRRIQLSRTQWNSSGLLRHSRLSDSFSSLSRSLFAFPLLLANPSWRHSSWTTVLP